MPRSGVADGIDAMDKQIACLRLLSSSANLVGDLVFAELLYRLSRVELKTAMHGIDLPDAFSAIYMPSGGCERYTRARATAPTWSTCMPVVPNAPNSMKHSCTWLEKFALGM